MRVRVLSEWAGSGRCGEIGDVPEAEAVQRIRGGWAEAVPEPPRVERAVVATPVETAVAPTRRPRGRRG